METAPVDGEEHITELASACGEELQKAADAIRDADALLICTGAGMGADSGLATYRGRNAGSWLPLSAMQMDYSEICDPHWFEDDCRLAWAFWHFCYEAYMGSSPHYGYELLTRWGASKAHGFFSVTSNIDGHWERTPGMTSERIWETHGAVTHMQCVADDGRIWPTDRLQMDAVSIPSWDLKPKESVQAHVLAEVRNSEGVHEASWVRAKVDQDGYSLVSPSGLSSISAKAVRRPDGPDLLRVAEGCPLPLCPSKRKPARPNVLMFCDFTFNSKRIAVQEAAFREWKSSLPRDARLAIVEVGAGKTVPTIRRLAESATREFPNSTLVRINVDDCDRFHLLAMTKDGSDAKKDLASRSIMIGGIGALDALTQINALL